MMIDSLLDDLTPPQRQAVLHRDGPLLVLAGAGSGKTRVITRRAAHLVLTGDDDARVLAVTFTNKAAGEMTQRLDALGVGHRLSASTFHGFCARLLRMYPDECGVLDNFTILDRDDRRKIIEQAIESAGLQAANYPPSAIEQKISRAKNALQSPAEFADAAADWQTRQIARFYQKYENLLADQNGLDFDDLLMRVALALARNEDLRTRVERRYHYVLIDEYQDTNAAQYQIARLLTKTRRNLCATGDPDQSIYGWRGADIGNILSFERDYPDAVVIRLEQNYRSTQRILSAASRLIAANVRRKDKALWTENDLGEPVRVIEHDDGATEAQWIVRDIASQLKGDLAPGDAAVFYRINAQSRALEEALLRAGIAYQIARGVEFYARREIKDVLAYLRILVNPRDALSLHRIINTPPRGIGPTSVERMNALAAHAGLTLLDWILSAGSFAEVGRSAARVSAFAELLRGLLDLSDAAPCFAVEQVLRRSGLSAAYLGEDSPDTDAAGNLRELLSAAAEFERDHADATLRDWLEHTSLIGDVDAVHDDRGRVTLMTLHSAKGLEFPHVYICGLEDGLLPMRRESHSAFQADDEEERRLLFVGMTRAMRRLTLSSARFRMIQGRAESRSRSPFLDDLPDDEIEHVAKRGGAGPARRSGRDRSPDDLEHWGVGTLVKHEEHGLGCIVAMHRSVRDTRIVVKFRSGRQSNMILEFAPLTRVDPYDIEPSDAHDSEDDDPF